jgi:hypothetical protein
MQFLSQLYDSCMSVDDFIYLRIAILHFLFLSQHLCETLLARETVDGCILHAVDQWMLGPVAMLV